MLLTLSSVHSCTISVLSNGHLTLSFQPVQLDVVQNGFCFVHAVIVCCILYPTSCLTFILCAILCDMMTQVTRCFVSEHLLILSLVPESHLQIRLFVFPISGEYEHLPRNEMRSTAQRILLAAYVLVAKSTISLAQKIGSKVIPGFRAPIVLPSSWCEKTVSITLMTKTKRYGEKGHPYILDIGQKLQPPPCAVISPRRSHEMACRTTWKNRHKWRSSLDHQIVNLCIPFSTPNSLQIY